MFGELLPRTTPLGGSPRFPGMLYFAAPTPPSPEPAPRPDPLEDIKKRMAASLAQDIIQINDKHYSRYSNTSSATDAEKETAQQQEEHDVIALVQPHMLDAAQATATEPSPNARMVAKLAYCTNNIAQRDAAMETDDAKKETIQNKRKEEIISVLMQYLSVGQPRPVEFPTPQPLPPQPARPTLRERGRKLTQWRPQRPFVVTPAPDGQVTEQIAEEAVVTDAAVAVAAERRAVNNRRWVLRGEGVVAAIILGGLLFTAASIKEANDNAVDPIILPTGQCVNAPSGTIAVGYDYALDGKHVTNGDNTATIVEFVGPGKFCAGSRRASYQYLGSTTLDHMNTVANNYTVQLQKTGCADGNGCEYIITQIHS